LKGFRIAFEVCGALSFIRIRYATCVVTSSGTPVDTRWHINVDRTGGKPITKESFAKSKQPFTTKNEPVDIIGFYSEHHAGVFLPKYTPVIKEGSGRENAIHIHLISKTSKAAGHIDDITLGENMVLRLPTP
jgi:acetolactate decarboxylase